MWANVKARRSALVHTRRHPRASVPPHPACGVRGWLRGHCGPRGLQVGDLIQIRNHEPVPADVLVMAAHEPDPAIPRGSCHVETKGLDGETNLKARNPTLL